MHSPLGASNFCKYTVPTSNQYAVFFNHLELQQLKDSTLSSDFGQPSRCLTNTSNNRSKRRYCKNSLSTTLNKRSTPHLLDNHNLQEFRKNETSPNPTIVNGTTYVNSNPKHKQEDSDVTSYSVNHLINNLWDTSVHNKGKHLPSNKHRIILVGDSHVRG